MPKTIKYNGTRIRWPELAVTGKQSVWNPGQQEERSDAEASLLLATGLFSGVQVPVTADPVTGAISPPVSGGGKVLDALRSTLAVCGVSIERGCFSDLAKRFDCTVGTWSNGIATLTATGHGVTIGTTFPADVYQHAGGTWSALGVIVTATDANTLTYPLAANPGPISDVVAVDVRLDKGIPISSATWSAGTATITMPIPLNLPSYVPADYRIVLSGVTDAAGAALAEYNGVANCAPIAFGASNQLAIYMAGDPGAAAAGGTIRFVRQYNATTSSWIHALNRILGLPFRIVADFAVGGAKPLSVARQVDQVLALPTLPTHCLIGGVENDITISGVELFRAAGRRLAAVGITPVLFDARPVALFATSAAAYDAYQRDLAVMCEDEGFILLTGGGVYQRPGSAPVADAYADTGWKLTPPTVDSTHHAKRGSVELAVAYALSDGGQKLARLPRSRQAAMLGGGVAGNLLPNPTFATTTGGVLGGTTPVGNVPASYQVFIDAGNKDCVCLPIKRSAPKKWLAGMTAAVGDVVFALTRSTPWLYVAQAAGAAAGAEPAWPAAHGGAVVDGGITWRAISPDCCDGGPGYWLQVTVPRPTALAISGVTQATPGVVTVGANTGLSNNRRVFIDGAGGMTQLNGRIWSVAGLAGNSFNLMRDDTNGNASTTGFGAWTSGGVVLPFTGVTINLAAALTKAAGGWAAGDRLRLTCELVCEDVEVMRSAIAQMAWPGGTSNSEHSFSANPSQGLPIARQTLGSEFMAPREMTAAAQTLNPTISLSLLSGTFRVAQPRLENLGAW